VGGKGKLLEKINEKFFRFRSTLHPESWFSVGQSLLEHEAQEKANWQHLEASALHPLLVHLLEREAGARFAIDFLPFCFLFEDFFFLLARLEHQAGAK
jgi:uridine kinase